MKTLNEILEGNENDFVEFSKSIPENYEYAIENCEFDYDCDSIEMKRLSKLADILANTTEEIIEEKILEKNDMVKCVCGCTIKKNMTMNASMGKTCSEHYDNFS